MSSKSGSKSGKKRVRQSESAGAGNQQTDRAIPGCGCWINLFDPTVGELVGHCGYDYALIDMEHSPVSIDAVLPMIRAVQSGGARALVRAPDKQVQWIGRMMDMGADGVMVPMVNTAVEAQELANASLYAPDGSRGMAAGIVRASRYGADTEQYLKQYRDKFLVMVQIETREAVEQVEEIAAVDGVDCLFIGPFDLSGSLGYKAQPDHKQTQAAMRRVRKVSKDSGKLLSTLITEKNTPRKLLGAGYDIVFSGMDLVMLRDAMSQDAMRCRNIIGREC